MFIEQIVRSEKAGTGSDFVFGEEDGDSRGRVYGRILFAEACSKTHCDAAVEGCFQHVSRGGKEGAKVKLLQRRRA